MTPALEKVATLDDWTRKNGRQSRRDYIWLLYSVFYFIEPFFHHSTSYWLECLGIYAVFLALYVACMQAETARASALWALSFAGLGLLSYPTNPGASTFFIFTAAVFPMCTPSIKLVASVVGAECVLVLAEGLFFHINLISVGSTVMFMIVLAVSNYAVGQQKRADCKLRMAHEEIEQLAALAERERIARDLHDVLGHTLSVIVLKAELAGRLLPSNPERAAREIADVETTARTALKEVREAIGGYRAQGLAAEIEQARRTLDAAGVALLCAAGAEGQALTVTQETVLSLAVREAVTNIVRHAEATECRVSISSAAGFHALQVEDDGAHAIAHEGNGLRGMRERVTALGGVFDVESGHGTRITIRLPIEAAR